MNTWQILEEKLLKEKIHSNETLFHTANGYIGVRGNFEEGVGSGIHTTQGSYINGFYETYELPYAEKYPGDSVFGQSIINVTDAQKIELWLDEEKFSIFQGSVTFYERKLDMKEGIVTRTIGWQSSKGHEIRLTIQRLTSFIQKELFIIRYSIKSINFQGQIKLKSSLINRAPSTEPENSDMRLGKSDQMFLDTKEIFETDNIGYVVSKTKNSNLDLVCSAAHHISKNASKNVIIKEQEISFEYQLSLMSNEQVQFDKYIVYSDSRRHKSTLEENTKIIKKVLSNQFSYYANAQQKYLSDFWEQADIIIEGDESNQAAIRFNLYGLLQSVGKDLYSSISAKGLAGVGYEGHYFWDTEIYIIPFFLFTHPELAKNLLLFRYHTLSAAREKAKQMGFQKGAMIPWRTINGSESGSYYPAGTAESHINPDLANAIILYYQTTDDMDFLADFGAEMLFETARVMYEIGHFRSDGFFCIDSVTGPDEYKYS